MRRHGPAVYAAARRRLPDPQDAADVFQATFLVLVRKAPHLAGRATVGPWLYRVAALTARNLRRRNARRLALRRPLADVATTLPPADLDDALLTLPERDRAAVVLCHLYGHTRREAAARLGVPEGTLSAVLHRALRTLRTRLGGDPLPLLAAGGVVVPAGVVTAACQSAAVVRVASLAAAAGPEVVSLTRGALRMFWLTKLTAGGMAAVACLGLGVGVGLAPRPAAVAADPPKAEPPADLGPDEKEVERLRKLATEAVRLEIEARMRASERVAAARRAEQQLAERRGAVIRLEVSAENRPFAAFVTLTETDAAGTVVAEFGCGGGKLGTASLATHLRRARLDPAGGRAVVMEVSPKFDPFDLGIVAQAVVGAGFPTVTYTGPLPESWTLGKNQDGKPARSWTGQKLVKGERVELAKVLPLDPPAEAGPPTPVDVIIRTEGKAVRLPLLAGDTVADLIRRAKLDDVAARPGTNVWVTRVGDAGEKVLPVDWVGITKHGDTKMNYQLQPGDRLHVEPRRSP